MRKIKTIWGILTGNLMTGYLSIGFLPDGRADLLVSTYKAKEGRKTDYDKCVILPTNSIVYIPTFTEGRIENPEEWLARTKGVVKKEEKKDA